MQGRGQKLKFTGGPNYKEKMLGMPQIERKKPSVSHTLLNTPVKTSI